MASSLEVLAANGVDVMEVALAVTRAGNLFTTHTAVAAGFDRFAPALIEQYLGGYAEQKLGITLHDLLALGRQNPNDSSAAPLPRTARYAMLNLS
jgi:starch phosphorylase